MLLIEIPLGVALALAMPKSGWQASLVLVLLALPLLIPWNVVGTIWQIFARADIGLLMGYTLNRLGIDYNYTRRPLDAWLTCCADGRVALDAAGGAAVLRRPARHPRRLLPGGADRRRLSAGRCSATSSCPRCAAC